MSELTEREKEIRETYTRLEFSEIGASGYTAVFSTLGYACRIEGFIEPKAMAEKRRDAFARALAKIVLEER